MRLPCPKKKGKKKIGVRTTDLVKFLFHTPKKRFTKKSY